MASPHILGADALIAVKSRLDDLISELAAMQRRVDVMLDADLETAKHASPTKSTRQAQPGRRLVK